MKVMQTKRQNQGVGVARCGAMAAAAVASGCAMMLPYDHVGVAPDPSARPAGLRLAGGTEAALQKAEGMRQQYHANLQGTALTRSSSAVLATALGGWAVYNTLKPGAGSDADKARGTRLGVGLGALYGLREFFVNAEQESAYSEGYRALTCLMLQSAPLLMTESADGGQTKGELDLLSDALKELELQITELHTNVAQAELEADLVAGTSTAAREAQKPQRTRYRDAREALSIARRTLADGKVLVAAVRGAGRLVEGRVGMVVGAVNEQVRKGQKDFKTAADLLKQTQDITSSILDLGNNSAADTAKDAATPATTGLAPLDAPAWELRLAGPLTALPASAAKPKAKASAANQPPSAPTPTTADLKAIRDQLDAALTAIAAREAQPARKAEQDSAAAVLADRDRKIAELSERLNADEARCTRGKTCAAEIAGATERLYAARRPVLYEVLAFRRLARTLANTPECLELAPLRVIPNEAIPVKPGQSVSFVISQRATGNPVVVLQGATEDDSGGKLVTQPMEGSASSMVRATVVIGKNMSESQNLRLVVTDSKGSAAQTIPIVAVPPARAASGGS